MRFQKLMPSEFPLAVQIASSQRSVFFQWDEQKILSELTQHQSFAALEGSEVLAFLVLAKRTDLIFEIPLLVTSASYQNKGVMQRLLVWLFASLPPEAELWLEVHQSNSSACNLYRKLGFEEVGLRKKYYQDGGAALLFTKYFK